jgi:hypothetical protein
MELVSMVRTLWRHRILLVTGVLLAAAVGFLAASGGLPVPGGSSGSQPVPRSASVRVLIDTASSQLVNPEPPAADTVVARAFLLAGLTASDRARADIARRVGVRPEQVAVIGPSVTVPVFPTKLSERATTAVEGAPEPYAVTLEANPEIPIVTIQVRAPGATKVRRLANATTAVLASLATPGDPEQKQGFTAEPLGRPRFAPVEGGLQPAVIALAAFLVTFAMWCGCVVLASGLTEAQRRSRARVA